jgi:hypothetical protein
MPVRVYAASILALSLWLTVVGVALAQNSEADCKKKYLIDTKPPDWKKYRECLSLITRRIEKK